MEYEIRLNLLISKGGGKHFIGLADIITNSLRIQSLHAQRGNKPNMSPTMSTIRLYNFFDVAGAVYSCQRRQNAQIWHPRPTISSLWLVAEEGYIVFTHMALYSPLFVVCDGIDCKFLAIKL